MLHKEIPFLRIGIPLCAGIISGLYFKPDLVFLISAGLLIIAGFTFSIFYNKFQTNQLFGLSLSLSLFVCGLLLYTREKESISLLKPERTVFSGTLSDYPEEKEKSYKLTVRLRSLGTNKKAEPVNGSMVLYVRKEPSGNSFLPGDQLIFRCSPAEITSRGNPFEFDYSFYMQNQGIKYSSFISSRDILKHTMPDSRKLIHRALIIREKIIDMYRQRGITGERLALVAAITLGQKNMLDPEQKDYFIKAGVMHIMAVSGLHSVILSLFVFSLLFFLKRRFNIVRIIITIIFLWAFAFVTGLTPSVLRATLMFSFLQAGNLMKRPVNGINSVLASAFFLILLKPSVIFDAGFLLSYSAVIYIIAFYRDLYLKLQLKSRIADKIWQSVVVTLVAQAGTLPLTIMLFNRFPTYFIITNLVIVPLSSLLVITGCIVPLLYPVVFISRFVAMLLSHMTGITELLTKKAASLPFATIEHIGMTTPECILLTSTIFLFSFYLLKRESFSVIYPLIFLMLFTLAGTVREITTRFTGQLIVYNTIGPAEIGIRTGKLLTIYSDTTVIGPEVSRHCAALGLKTSIKPLKDRSYCIQAGGFRILITGSADENMVKRFSPDILILTDPKPMNNKSRQNILPQNKLIINVKGASSSRFAPARNQPKYDSVYFVRKTGAFLRRI